MKTEAIFFVGVIAAASASVVGAQEPMSDTLTIVNWGGALAEAQQRALVAPYSEQNGVKVVTEQSSANAVAKLRAMQETNNVTWDVVDMVAADAIRACDEGLVMEIDADTMLAPAPNGGSAEEDFGEMRLSDCFIPQFVYSTTFGYRTDVKAWNGQKPESVCAIFDLEQFPGKRSLEKRPVNNLEWALLCDGVARDDIYDQLRTQEGRDRAFDKLATIRDQVIWWTAGAETPQLLADGEVVMGSTYNGRLFSVIEEQNQPVEMLWDWQVYDVDGWVIPANFPAERRARALDFVRFATDTQRQADLASLISYGPTRASSQPLVGKHAELGVEMAPHMPTSPENSENTLLFNVEFWASYSDELDQRFQSWLIQ
jgi:putative spermidine/putrescine transport system substrate-binding protein